MTDAAWRTAAPTWLGCGSAGARPRRARTVVLVSGGARDRQDAPRRRAGRRAAREGTRVVYVGGADARGDLPSGPRTGTPSRRTGTARLRRPGSGARPRRWLARRRGGRHSGTLAARRPGLPRRPAARCGQSPGARSSRAQGAERLALRPLGAKGVREIVELYAGERAAYRAGRPAAGGERRGATAHPRARGRLGERRHRRARWRGCRSHGDAARRAPRSRIRAGFGRRGPPRGAREGRAPPTGRAPR